MLRKRRSRLILSAIVLMLLAVGVCWLLFGITINLPPTQRPIDQLTAARAVWQAHNQTDYSMWIRLHSFSMIGTYKIGVKNNQVTSVQDGHLQVCDACPLTPANAQALDAYQTAFGKFFPVTLTDLTMDNLYDFAADKLKDEPAPPILALCSSVDTDRWRYEATYDQAQGYLTSLNYTNCPRYTGGGGLMCPAVSDCSAGIEISNVLP